MNRDPFGLWAIPFLCTLHSTLCTPIKKAPEGAVFIGWCRRRDSHLRSFELRRASSPLACRPSSRLAQKKPPQLSGEVLFILWCRRRDFPLRFNKLRGTSSLLACRPSSRLALMSEYGFGLENVFPLHSTLYTLHSNKKGPRRGRFYWMVPKARLPPLL